MSVWKVPEVQPYTKADVTAAAAERKPWRWAKLGFTLDDYALLLAAQDGHCAVCPAKPTHRRLNVDHDHKTGKVRGLLCHAHNRRLWAGATPTELRKLADYLADYLERAA